MTQERLEAPAHPFPALKPGETRAIADGVLWLRLPTPSRLGHVNVYLLADDDGWTIVDTGHGDARTEELLAEVLARELGGAPVARVLCTHMHPDHVGLAGWLCRRYDAPLCMARLEYLSARVLAGDAPPAPQEAIDVLVAAGWEPAWIDVFRGRFGGYARAVRALPQTFVRVEDRDDVVIGGRVWRVITGAGHSPEHLCLWQPDLKLFIAGDQAPAKPTSAVSVWPGEPGADPLSDWISSCWRIMAAIPDDVLVLPSRDTPYHGLHARLDALIADAEERLERTKAALGSPKRVVDLWGEVLLREVEEAGRVAATGEVLACLNHLARKGRAGCEVDESGVAWFVLEGEDGPEDADDF
jgi:glyoxylase-like metal-dependent hydrolase (beta-lactamase superfamily II)